MITVVQAATPARPAGLVQRLSWALRSYALLVIWEARSLRLSLPVIVVVQIFLGAGIVVGFGFLFEDLSRAQATYFVSGGSAIALMSMGYIFAPQLVAQQKLQGTYEYIWTLPVPRFAVVAAGTTVMLAAALPGMALALLAGWLRYDVSLAVSPLIVPAALLVVLSATLVGYGMGHASPNPLLTNAITQLVIFIVTLYSPVNFPPERLPEWLEVVHVVLPFKYAAAVIRDGLTDGLTHDVGLAYGVLLAWAAGGTAALIWVLGRRG